MFALYALTFTLILNNTFIPWGFHVFTQCILVRPTHQYPQLPLLPPPLSHPQSISLLLLLLTTLWLQLGLPTRVCGQSLGHGQRTNSCILKGERCLLPGSRHLPASLLGCWSCLTEETSASVNAMTSAFQSAPLSLLTHTFFCPVFYTLPALWAWEVVGMTQPQLSARCYLCSVC